MDGPSAARCERARGWLALADNAADNGADTEAGDDRDGVLDTATRGENVIDYILERCRRESQGLFARD
jgi:hypothetical protein